MAEICPLFFLFFCAVVLQEGTYKNLKRNNLEIQVCDHYKMFYDF